MNNFKLAIFACVLFFVGAGATSAADRWDNEFYLGGNVGYSWGRTAVTTTIGAFSTTLFTGDFFGNTQSTELKPVGFIAGGQIGHNWRVMRT